MRSLMTNQTMLGILTDFHSLTVTQEAPDRFQAEAEDTETGKT